MKLLDKKDSAIQMQNMKWRTKSQGMKVPQCGTCKVQNMKMQDMKASAFNNVVYIDNFRNKLILQNVKRYV